MTALSAAQTIRPPIEREAGDVPSGAQPVITSVARVLLVATLFAAPLAFGAVQTWAWAALTVMAVALLILWAVGTVLHGALRLHGSPLYVPAILFLWLGIFQLISHRTLDPFATQASLIEFATDLIFFFVAIELWSSARPTVWEKFGLAVTLYAFAMAVFAIIQFFSSAAGVIYWHVNTAGGSFGPYVDHDHYAGLMEMLIPIALGYALSRPQRSPQRAVLAFGGCIAIASLLLSGSRGGMISVIVELAVLAVLLWRREKQATRTALGLVGVAGGVALFLAISPSYVYTRLATVTGLVHSPEVTMGERLTVSRDAIGILRDHLLLGSGMGTFAVAFSKYQTLPTNFLWDHAHDDYVEAITETGIVGGLLVLASLFLFFRLAVRDLAERLKSAAGCIQLGAALGCCGLLVHSFADFNLHIPANAAWFAMCVAVAGREWRVDGARCL